MLVLSRKIKEEILIGDNIKVTLLKVNGNTVRIGIKAPRDIRIRRSELESLASDQIETLECDDDESLSIREQAFAHPQPIHNPSPSQSVPVEAPVAQSTNRIADDPQVFVGKVSASGSDAQLMRVATEPRAPLADFITAT